MSKREGKIKEIREMLMSVSNESQDISKERHPDDGVSISHDKEPKEDNLLDELIGKSRLRIEILIDEQYINKQGFSIEHKQIQKKTKWGAPYSDVQIEVWLHGDYLDQGKINPEKIRSQLRTLIENFINHRPSWAD